MVDRGKNDITGRYDLQLLSGVVVRTHRTELILLYVILRSIINIIDRLFLNSVQRSQWAHMSTSSLSGARGLQRSPYFEINIVMFKNGEVDSLTNPRLVLQETPPPRSLGPSVHDDGILVHYGGISVHYEGIIGYYDGITIQYRI